MTDQSPQWTDDFLRSILDDGTLARLAEFATDEHLRAELRLAKVRVAEKAVTYIDAAVDVLLLSELGHKEPGCRNFIEKHYFGQSEMATRIARRGAGSKINRPAQAIFKQLKADPAAYERRLAAVKLKNSM